MNLKKIITQSLVEIMTGVKDARDQLKDFHARICPTLAQAITSGGQQSLIALSAKGQVFRRELYIRRSAEAMGDEHGDLISSCVSPFPG